MSDPVLLADGRAGETTAPALGVMEAMREASAIGTLYGAAVARRLGVGSSDLECLDFIAVHQPVTAGVLARRTGLTTGAITGVIDRLVNAGLARRNRPDADRRKVLVSTTEDFATRVLPLFEPMRRRQSEVVGMTSARNLRIVADFTTRSLDAARRALEEVSGPDDPSSVGPKGRDRRP